MTWAKQHKSSADVQPQLCRLSVKTLLLELRGIGMWLKECCWAGIAWTTCLDGFEGLILQVQWFIQEESATIADEIPTTTPDLA